MSAERRVVRPTAGFFDDLDRQLGPERGFDALPEPIPGRPDYRVLIAAGTIVSRYAVTAQLMADDSIEMVQLDIDDSW